MENSIDTEKILEATKALIINTLVNDYAMERVAFRYEKPGDKAPIELYAEHLNISRFITPDSRECIPGTYVDGQERISTEYDYDKYVRDLLVLQIEKIFADAPKDVRLEREGEEIPLLPRFRKYLFGLLPMFTEILNVEVEYDFFDVIPTDKAARATEYPKWQKFVTAILLKPLKSGSRINRYVKDFTCAPYYVNRLIEKKGGNFYLRTADIESREYIFALFSLMRFMNAENNNILELKMREWARRNN